MYNIFAYNNKYFGRNLSQLPNIVIEYITNYVAIQGLMSYPFRKVDEDYLL